MPLTWRNVTGASAGNPSSSLSTATSAFANVGRNALDRVDSIRKGEEIKRELQADQVISDVLSSGRPINAQTLQDFIPEGADTTAILSGIQGYQINQENLETADANQRLSAARSLDLENRNTPEAIEHQRGMERREAELAQAELDHRKNYLAWQQANTAAEKATREGILSVQKLTYDEGEEGLRGQAIRSLDANREAALQRYHDSLGDNPATANLSSAEKQRLEDQWWSDNYDNFVEQEMARLAPKWLGEQQVKYGLTTTQLRETTIGNRFLNVEAANTEAISEEAARERAELRDAAKRAQTGLDNRSYSSLRLSGDGFAAITNKQDQKDNTLSKSDMIDFIDNRLRIDLAEDEEDQAQDLLERVGGNKEVFTAIMNDVTDKNFGDDFIDWDAANLQAQFYVSKMRGSLQRTVDAANAPSGDDFLTFNELVSGRRRPQQRRAPQSQPLASNRSLQEQASSLLAETEIGRRRSGAPTRDESTGLPVWLTP